MKRFRIYGGGLGLLLSAVPPVSAEPTLAEMLQWRAAVPIIASERNAAADLSAASLKDEELLYVPRRSGAVFAEAIEAVRGRDSEVPAEKGEPPHEAPGQPALPDKSASEEDVKIY